MSAVQKQFGNWTVDDTVINWTAGQHYWVGFSDMDKVNGEGDEQHYNWPVHLAQKPWLDPADLSDFNDAFSYAMGLKGKSVDPDIWAETMSLQTLILNRR